MTAERPFLITRRSLGSDGEPTLAIEDAPAPIATIARWFSRSLGLDALMLSERREDGLGQGFFVTDWPRDLMLRAANERWYENDPIGAAVLSSESLLRPSDIEVGALSEVWQDRVRVRLEAGVPLPYGLVVKRTGKIVGNVTACRFRPLAPDEEQVLTALGPGLLLTALDHFRARTVAGITPRERECLAWASEGKTAWETAAILDISEHTVVVHLKNAGHKLGAANRLQAVAEALRLGLIE